MRLTIIPSGEEKRRLLVSARIERWTYNGEPARGEARHGGRVIPLWLFRLSNIEEGVVQRHFIWFFMSRYGLTQQDTIEFLASRYIGIPCDRIALALYEGEDEHAAAD